MTWLFRPPDKMGRTEKAIWTLLMLLLVGLEIRTLYLDRDEHDAEQNQARCEQIERFGEIAKGIEKSVQQSQQQYNSIVTTAQNGPREAMTKEEQIRDDALAEGMDCEYMRITRDIDELISTRSEASSYGRGQRYILRQLKEKIAWMGSSEPAEKETKP